MSEYKIDLKTLLLMLEELFQSGILSTTFVRGRSSRKDKYLATLEIANGKVMSCVIVDSKGQIFLSGGGALDMLQGLDACLWRFDVQHGQPFVKSSSPNAGIAQFSPVQPSLNPANTQSSFPIPKQAFSGNSQSMDRYHRRVFALVDGRRSVEKIAHISALDVYTVLALLHDLEMMGLISY